MKNEHLDMVDTESEFSYLEIIAFAILFYFFLHSMTTLVHSIYLLDLLNTQIDEKVLGLLFFFSTFYLLFLRETAYLSHIRGTGTLFVLLRIIYPYLSTSYRLLVSGIATALFLIFFPLYIYHKKQQNSMLPANSIGLSLLFGTMLSVLLRSANSSWDITEFGNYRIIGLFLGLIPIYYIWKNNSFQKIENKSVNHNNDEQKNNFLPEVLGLFSFITLIYFGFGSPAVFARWSSITYFWIIVLISLIYGLTIIFILFYPTILNKLSNTHLLIWNTSFFGLIVVTILLNQVDFLSNTENSPIIASQSNWLSTVSMFLMLILSPVIFIDLMVFVNNLFMRNINLKNLSQSFLLSELILVLLTFIFILTNTWGYVDPISTIFRGMFWLPFAILGLISLITIITSRSSGDFLYKSSKNRFFAVLSLVLMLAIVFGALLVPQTTISDDNSNLVVMTYNIQQGADINGEINYVDQLNLIKEINPDIIGLQESDTAKINTANTDIVRFFADQLEYYSFYGPKTVMQTFGVALLSRFPIINPNTFYTVGNVDEIGSIYALVKKGSITYNVFVNHPAGNNISKLDHTYAMLDLAENKDYVILMGDFNWNEQSVFYNMVTSSYIDTWRAIYPNGIDDNDLNMNSTIDHIFVSDDFSIIDSTYIPSPASETDHPAYWTEVTN